ncbi:hypothetical protein KAR91_52450 [Candidatus Pacearchaeota archaeon]|nr:hypothetical protein [Candidatus Pacearchaeota archaeon]
MKKTRNNWLIIVVIILFVMTGIFYFFPEKDFRGTKDSDPSSSVIVENLDHDIVKDASKERGRPTEGKKSTIKDAITLQEKKLPSKIHRKSFDRDEKVEGPIVQDENYIEPPELSNNSKFTIPPPMVETLDLSKTSLDDDFDEEDFEAPLLNSEDPGEGPFYGDKNIEEEDLDPLLYDSEGPSEGPLSGGL